MRNPMPEPIEPDKPEALRLIAEAVRQVHAEPGHSEVKPKNLTGEGELEAEPEEPRKSPWEILRDMGMVSGEPRVYRPEAFRLEPRYPERQPGEFEPPSDDFEPYMEWEPGAHEES